MKSTQGKPLYQVDAPQIFQLQYDESGREAVKKVLSDYEGTRAALSTFDSKAKKGPVRGSNVYSRFALGNVYRALTNEDVRPITPKESEIALDSNALTKPTETYEDLGLPVYRNKGANPVLWKHLREQIKSNFEDVNLNKPFVVTGLMGVIIDDKYENGLRFDLNELTEVYNVPILSKKTGSFTSDDPELQRTGFPSKLGEGNRTLWTASKGVRKLYRFRNLYLLAYDAYLADSDDTGRVHFAKNFSSGNLDEILAKNLKKQEI